MARPPLRAGVVYDFRNPPDSGIDTLPAGGYDNALFGVIYAPSDAAPTEVFFDEVAVSRVPLACD